MSQHCCAVKLLKFLWTMKRHPIGTELVWILTEFSCLVPLSLSISLLVIKSTVHDIPVHTFLKVTLQEKKK